MKVSGLRFYEFEGLARGEAATHILFGFPFAYIAGSAAPRRPKRNVL